MPSLPAGSARDAAHRGLAEASEVLGFGDPRQLAADGRDGLRHRAAVAEEDAISALERGARLAREPAPFEPDGVDPCVARRAARGSHERRDVLRDARAAADHAVAADAREL